MHIAIDARPFAIPRGGIRRYTECLIRALSRVDGENRYALCGAPRNADDGLAALERELDPGRFQVHREPFPRARTLEHLWLVSAPGPVDLYHGTNYGAPWFFARPTVITGTPHAIASTIVSENPSAAVGWTNRSAPL